MFNLGKSLHKPAKKPMNHPTKAKFYNITRPANRSRIDSLLQPQNHRANFDLPVSNEPRQTLLASRHLAASSLFSYNIHKSNQTIPQIYRWPRIRSDRPIRPNHQRRAIKSTGIVKIDCGGMFTTRVANGGDNGRWSVELNELWTSSVDYLETKEDTREDYCKSRKSIYRRTIGWMVNLSGRTKVILTSWCFLGGWSIFLLFR